MSICRMCTSEFEDAQGGHTEWGFFCGSCIADYERVPTHEGGGVTGGDIAANVVGIGLLAVTGVGFTKRSRDPRPIPDARRREMFHSLVDARVARGGVRRRPGIKLRRGGSEEYGPYTMAQLEQMWNEGLVLPTDQYWYEGMAEWAPVTAFVPPPIR